MPVSEDTEEKKDPEEPEKLEDPVRPQEPDSGCAEVVMAVVDEEDLEDGEIVD